MSLRPLPALECVRAFHGEMSWDVPDVVQDVWRPGVRAAAGDRTLTIFDEIGDSYFGDGMTSKRCAGILRSMGPGDITVQINSPGGDFFEGVAIYNLLREHEGRVDVHVIGLAASAASVIAMAGDQILVPRAGFLMIHNAWGLTIGNRHDLAAAIVDLEQFDQAMQALYAERAGVDPQTIAEWMDQERFFNGDAAVDNGLADGLLPSDGVVEAETEIPVARRAERAMRAGGMSRNQCRSLIGALRAPGGAADAECDAGIVAALQDLQSTILSWDNFVAGIAAQQTNS